MVGEKTVAGSFHEVNRLNFVGNAKRGLTERNVRKTETYLSLQKILNKEKKELSMTKSAEFYNYKTARTLRSTSKFDETLDGDVFESLEISR